MKNTFTIATFNANSIRARLPIITQWLAEHRVDCLCIQETKVQDPDFPVQAFSEMGYNVIFKGQKAYNGVAVASPHEIEDVFVGFGDGQDTLEDMARLLRCRIRGLQIVNVYAPQGKAVTHPDFTRKLLWFERLFRMFEHSYHPDDHIVCCGDMNVAPGPEDVYAPERMGNHVCFHEDVRAALQKILDWGFVDVFRQFHKEQGQYTFFDYRLPGAIKKGLGWRIDLILATTRLATKALDSYIDMAPRLATRPSDHTFLVARFAY